MIAQIHMHAFNVSTDNCIKIRFNDANDWENGSLSLSFARSPSLQTGNIDIIIITNVIISRLLLDGIQSSTACDWCRTSCWNQNRHTFVLWTIERIVFTSSRRMSKRSNQFIYFFMICKRRRSARTPYECDYKLIKIFVRSGWSPASLDGVRVNCVTALNIRNVIISWILFQLTGIKRIYSDRQPNKVRCIFMSFIYYGSVHEMPSNDGHIINVNCSGACWIIPITHDSQPYPLHKQSCNMCTGCVVCMTPSSWYIQHTHTYVCLSYAKASRKKGKGKMRRLGSSKRKSNRWYLN